MNSAITAVNILQRAAIDAAESAPVNTVLPVISGTMLIGQTLTVSDGTWLHAPTSYTRQWKRNGVNIPGATNTTYLLTSADDGYPITAEVTATNLTGSTAATSEARNLTEFININRQILIPVWIDSLLITTQSQTRGPAPSYTNSVFQFSNPNVISLITTTDVTGATNGSICPKMGNDIYMLTGLKPIFVVVAVGGTKLGEVTPYNNAKTKIANAIATAGVSRVYFHMFSGGINNVRDNTKTEAVIQGDINTFFSTWNTDFPNDKKMCYNMFRRSEFEPGVDTRLINCRAFFATAVSVTPNCIDAGDLQDWLRYQQNDLLHINQYGLNDFASKQVKNFIDNGHLPNNPITQPANAIAEALFALYTFSAEERRIFTHVFNYLEPLGHLGRIDSLKYYQLSDATTRLRDLIKSSIVATLVGDAAYVTNRGIRTNSGYIRSGFIPSVHSTPTGFLSNNNISGYAIFDRFSPTGSKRTVAGVVGSVANRHLYATEVDGLTDFTQVNCCGVEDTETPAVGNTKMFIEGLVLNRRSGIGAHQLQVLSPEVFVSGTNNSVGLPNLEVFTGARNNNGVADEQIDITVAWEIQMNGTNTDYLVTSRKFQEIQIDISTWN